MQKHNKLQSTQVQMVDGAKKVVALVTFERSLHTFDATAEFRTFQFQQYYT